MNIKPVVLTSLTFSETVCNKLKLYNMSNSRVQKKAVSYSFAYSNLSSEWHKSYLTGAVIIIVLL